MIRSPMKRTQFKPVEPKPEAGPRQTRCGWCKTKFVADPPWLKHCSDDCGAELGMALAAKQKAKAQRQERAETKKKLAEYETIPQLKFRLQTVFNLYIRLRDEIGGYPCICCGKWPKGDASLTGGQWDACHWKGRGAHDHLRFNEDNVHRGLKDCNKYGHTDYRGGLIKRIGLERVEALENNHAVIKWTREGLLAMIAEYSIKVKQLKKEQSCLP
jgi:hypothetical protein